MHRRLLLLLTIWVGLGFPCALSAQILEDATLPAPRTGTDHIVIPDNLLAGDHEIDAILRFQFDRADSIFRARQAAEPDNPEWQLGLGLAGWWRYIAGVVPVDAKRVEKDLERVNHLSREWADENPPRKAHALYCSGRAQSLLASLYLIEGSRVAAARAGQRSRAYLEKCLDADPDYTDAALGLGIYHYYADALPKFFKVLGWVFGLRGDREGGLRELRQAMNVGPRTGGEAAYFLANVLANFELAPDRALPLMRWLTIQYPENYVFFSEYLNVLELLGYYAEAEQQMRAAVAPGGRFEGQRAIRMLLGRNLYRQARYREGAETLEALIDEGWTKQEPAVPWFFYFAGRCRDLSGDATRAKAHYEMAKSFKVGGNAADLAKGRLKHPESVDVRRLRSARGLTRRDDMTDAAVEAWTNILADAQRGTLDADLPLDLIRYRQALCLEEDGRSGEAAEAYGRVEDPELVDRARMARARCLWRDGQESAALDALAAMSDDETCGLRLSARRMMRQLRDREFCVEESASRLVPAQPAGEGTEALIYRDSEAWCVELLTRTQGGENRIPMRFERGAWRLEVPAGARTQPYAFWIDAHHRALDPLVRWEEAADGSVWSLRAQPPMVAERDGWTRDAHAH